MSERTVPDFHVEPIATANGPQSETRGQVIDWELARLKTIMPRVVSRAMSYSAMTRFDEALVASVQRFYGLDVDVATAETEVLEDDIERVRFFPWFLWDFHHGAGAPTVGACLFVDGDLAPIERRVLRALCETVVDFWEVVALDRDGLEVVALGLGLRARVDDEVLGTELAVGQILQGRIVIVAADDGADGAPGEADDGPPRREVALLDAIYAVLPASTRPAILAELEAVVGPPDEGAMPTRVERMKQHAPELIDFAEYLLESANETASVENGDGETMVLCQTIVLRDHALALEAALLSGELGLVPMAGDEAWVSMDGDKPIGFVAHDVVHGRWVVGAPSRERLARVVARLAEVGVITAGLHAEEQLERAAEAWIETGVAGPHLALDPEVRAAFARWVEGRWVDTPHPRLGDTSPRQAARDEGLKPVLERLVQRIEGLVGQPMRAALGLE